MVQGKRAIPLAIGTLSIKIGILVQTDFVVAELTTRILEAMFLIIGTLIHIIIGASMRWAFGWNAWIVATIFAAKELGELKEKLVLC